MTGHWPVVKLCDFAQPSPIWIDRRAVLGGVVDAARIAGDVQARDAELAGRAVTSMIEFSTVAGAS